MSPPAITYCLELTPIRRKRIMKGAMTYLRHPVEAVAIHNGPTGTWPLAPNGGQTEGLQVCQADQAPGARSLADSWTSTGTPTFPGPCQWLPTLTGLHEAPWGETISRQNGHTPTSIWEASSSRTKHRPRPALKLMREKGTWPQTQAVLFQGDNKCSMA